MKKEVLIAAGVAALTLVITSSELSASNDSELDADIYMCSSVACDTAYILGGNYETADEAETEAFAETVFETSSENVNLKESADSNDDEETIGEATEAINETTENEGVNTVKATETAQAEETTGIEDTMTEETTGVADTVIEETKKTVETTTETKKSEETTAKETTAETTAVDTAEETKSLSTSSSSLSIVQALGDVNADIVAAANKELEFVPEFLLDAFVENGWEYYVSEEDLATKFWKGTYAYGTVLGTSELGAHKIYLDNRTEAAEYTLHEFGHFVDKYFNYPSQTDEFASIYKSEASTFNSVFEYSHFGTNEYEIFAQSFQVYLKYPEKLASNCPKLYEFMSQYVIE